MFYLMLIGAVLLVWWLIARERRMRAEEQRLGLGASAPQHAPARAGAAKPRETSRPADDEVAFYDWTQFDAAGQEHASSIDFKEMVLGGRTTARDGSRSFMTFDVRRTDGPVWQFRPTKKLAQEALREAEARFFKLNEEFTRAKNPSTALMKRHGQAMLDLKEMMDWPWKDIGAESARIETAYQRYLHAR